MESSNEQHSSRDIREWCDFLRRVPLFRELEEESLREVSKKLKSLSLPKGAIVYRAGETADALYIIQTGRVEVVSQKEDGKEIVLNYLWRGDTFGESALLTGATRSVTVRVDSTANFLVLYKRDFETFLKKNPRASLYLSRVISQRLIARSRSLQAPPFNPELIGIFCELKKEDLIPFAVNLSLALTEQTKRKILLLDCTPFASELTRSIGCAPILSSQKMLSSKDVVNPEVLQRITLLHPSGLEVISLPLEIFSGPLFRSIPAFLATLREIYDYSIVTLHSRALADASNQNQKVLDAFLMECDSFFYISAGETNAQGRLEQLLQSQGKENARKILLQKNSLQPREHFDFAVPWTDVISRTMEKTGRSYLTGPESEPTYKALNRIARFIGKLQVGVAMGAGGAYGYTLIGLLKVFEREKIPIDFISGTSMGALIGSFYASGKSVQEMEEIALSISRDWLRKNFLSDLNFPFFHGGLLKGLTISQFLRKHLGEIDFRELKIPFVCTATDAVSGDGVILREGKVWEAVRASLSLPLIFVPYKCANRFLMDGGLVQPVPAAAVASMGADILISVNLTSKASERKVALRRFGIFRSKTPGIFDIFFKMIYTMQYQVASLQTDLSQILIRPEMGNFSWIEFYKAKQIIPLGEKSAEESLAKIKSQLPFFSDTCKVPLRSLR